MAVMFAPVLFNPAFWTAVGNGLAYVGSAVVVGVGTGVLINEITSEDDDTQAPPIADTGNCTDCGDACPECVPPKGTKRVERVDIVPPSKPHWPCAGTHAHIVFMNQIPSTCVCRWDKVSKPNDVVCLDGWVPGNPLPFPMK